MSIIVKSSLKNTNDLPVMSEINVTPFIDVMLVLLIIFMIVAPLSTTNISVKLPTIQKQALPDTTPPLTVTIKSNGEIYVMNNKVMSSDFMPELLKEAGEKKDKQIFLRADKDVSYGIMMSLMNELQKAGISNVALVAMEADDE